MERTDQGLWPSCALKCPTGALIFGPPLRVVQEVRLKEALRIVRSFSDARYEVC
jgi:Fe-S-cluster-containing dehydrogenase component